MLPSLNSKLILAFETTADDDNSGNITTNSLQNILPSRLRQYYQNDYKQNNKKDWYQGSLPVRIFSLFTLFHRLFGPRPE